jgi:hypothetical protein
MDEYKENSLIFETLNKIRKLESPLISMWALNDKYASPPYLSFRFKDTSNDDAIYKTIAEIVKEYKGNLQWEVIHEESKSISFFILPNSFATFFFEDSFIFEKESFMKFLSFTEYKDVIDKAISDVPDLARFIAERYEILK